MCRKMPFDPYHMTGKTPNDTEQILALLDDTDALEITDENQVVADGYETGIYAKYSGIGNGIYC
jgi:hypothetical protein